MRGAVARCSVGQLAAFIQQRIRHVYRRQRPTPLPSRTQPKLGVDGLKVAHPSSLELPASGLTRRVSSLGFWPRTPCNRPETQVVPYSCVWPPANATLLGMSALPSAYYQHRGYTKRRSAVVSRQPGSVVVEGRDGRGGRGATGGVR
jgi:hypothetical protein